MGVLIVLIFAAFQLGSITVLAECPHEDDSLESWSDANTWDDAKVTQFHYILISLTLYVLMDSSFWFHSIKLELSIAYIALFISKYLLLPLSLPSWFFFHLPMKTFAHVIT